MKRTIAVLAVLMFAVPALATVTITAVDEGSCVVRIDYSVSGEPNLARAFALDLTVTDGNIVACEPNVAGECTSTSKGFGIFPGTIDVNDITGVVDSNGTPVAPQGDLPSDTLPGLDSNGITIETGSLYVDSNAPGNTGTLCRITVDAACTLNITTNVSRAGVVLENGASTEDAVSPVAFSYSPTAVACGCDPDTYCLQADITDPDYGAPDGKITYEDFVWLSSYYPAAPATEYDCLGDSYCLQADITDPDYGAPDGKITYEDFVWLSSYYPASPATEHECCL